jgi:hypothetical protein
VYQDTRQTSEYFSIFNRQGRKQLAKNMERVSERGETPRQTGEWDCIFTRQSWILLTVGEWLSTPLLYIKK